MSSLAEAPDLVGFFSYSREDDEGSGGRLSKLRERIQEELRSQLGRTRKDFRLWQDKTAIAHGELWEDTIKKGISEAVFFIPIITPTAVRSSYCKFEFQSFLAREKELERNNLIFPILYIPVPALTGDRWRQDPLLAIIGSRQYEDWQNLRHLDASSSEVVALRVQTFCTNICRALEQEWLSPEERREAEARRVAEAERRREAEIKQRADEEERRLQETITRFDNPTLRLAEAEAEKRRQDEERQRLEEERIRAAKEEQRRKRVEQEPQQSVKPWLLPVIGAGATFTSMLLFVGFGSTFFFHWYWFIFLIPHALYGGTAGMLVNRFGIPQAIAFPVVPAIFLYFVLIIAFHLIVGANIEYVFTWNNIGNILLGFVFSVVSAGLAFWLHSLWVRKQRLREAGG
jgi:TIR domain